MTRPAGPPDEFLDQPVHAVEDLALALGALAGAQAGRRDEVGGQFHPVAAVEDPEEVGEFLVEDHVGIEVGERVRQRPGTIGHPPGPLLVLEIEVIGVAAHQPVLPVIIVDDLVGLGPDGPEHVGQRHVGHGRKCRDDAIRRIEQA